MKELDECSICEGIFSKTENVFVSEGNFYCEECYKDKLESEINVN